MIERPWDEISEGCRIWRYPGRHRTFGPVTVLAVEISPRRFALISAPAHPRSDMAEALQRAGDVVALVAPNIAHVSGLHDWKWRCPKAECFGPDDQLPAMMKKTKLSFQPVSALLAEEGVEFYSAPGTRSGAVWVKSRLGSRPVVYLDELVTTMKERPQSLISAVLYRLTRTGPDLSLNQLFLKLLVSDRAAHLQAALDFTEGATAIAVAHGETVVGDERVHKTRDLIAQRQAQ